MRLIVINADGTNLCCEIATGSEGYAYATKLIQNACRQLGDSYFYLEVKSPQIVTETLMGKLLETMTARRVSPEGGDA